MHETSPTGNSMNLWIFRSTFDKTTSVFDKTISAFRHHDAYPKRRHVQCLLGNISLNESEQDIWNAALEAGEDKHIEPKLADREIVKKQEAVD